VIGVIVLIALAVVLVALATVLTDPYPDIDRAFRKRWEARARQVKREQ